MGKLETSHIETCTVHHLPGRDWYYLIGPLNTGARNLSFGIAEFPGKSLAGEHTHLAEEEILYILSGRGTVLSEGEETPVEPGSAVFIPTGVPHQIRVESEEPLRLVTVFSPPTTPGEYDPTHP